MIIKTDLEHLDTLVILQSIRKLEDERFALINSGTYHDTFDVDFQIAGRKTDLIPYMN